MNELNYVMIGKQIKKRRKDMGVTQEQLANYLDVNPSHISNIENGRAHPSLSALINIANYLKCSVDLFIASEYDCDLEKINSKVHSKSKIDKQLELKLKACDDAVKEKLIKIVDIL